MSDAGLYRKFLNDRIQIKLHQKGISADTGLAENIFAKEKFRSYQNMRNDFQYAYFCLGDTHLDGYVIDPETLYLVSVESNPYAYRKQAVHFYGEEYLSPEKMQQVFEGLKNILDAEEKLAAYRSFSVAKLGRFLKSKKSLGLKQVKFILLTNRQVATDHVDGEITWEKRQLPITCEVWSIERIFSLGAMSEKNQLPAGQKARVTLSDEEYAIVDDFCSSVYTFSTKDEVQREVFKLGSVRLQRMAAALVRYVEQPTSEIGRLLERLSKAQLPPDLPFWPTETEAALLGKFAKKIRLTIPERSHINPE